MNGLMVFIESRLVVDEQHARKDLHYLDAATSGGSWEYGIGHNLPWSELGEGGSIGRLTSENHANDVMLVARMVRTARRRAERALREVAATRALIERVFGYEAKIDGEWGCRHSEEDIAAGRCEYTSVEGIEALRLIAAVWSDHPDYLSEWAPEARSDG